MLPSKNFEFRVTFEEFRVTNIVNSDRQYDWGIKIYYCFVSVMGFGNFDTTKNKKIKGNDVGDVNILAKRKYRQYMNRKGGFNRPLDYTHWIPPNLMCCPLWPFKITKFENTDHMFWETIAYIFHIGCDPNLNKFISAWQFITSGLFIKMAPKLTKTKLSEQVAPLGFRNDIKRPDNK